MRFKKKSGVVSDLVEGTGGIIILTIIVLVIVSTLLGASLLGSDDTAGVVTTNELNGWLNTTSYQLGTSNSSLSNYAITQATNSTSTEEITSGNFTLVAATGLVTNASTQTFKNVSYNWTATFSWTNDYEAASNRMSTNFTQGIDNVSSKDSNNLIDCSCCITFRCNRIVSKTSWCNGYRYWRSFIVNTKKFSLHLFLGDLKLMVWRELN